MSTTAESIAPIRAKIADLRDRKKSEQAIIDRGRAAFAAATDKNAATRLPEVQAATEAVARRQDVEEKLAQAQKDEMGVLAMLGENTPPPGLNGGSDGDTAGLTGKPGQWLSSVLSKRAKDVPSLPDETRFAATLMAGDTGTTADYSTVAEGNAVIDLLAPASVATASGIGVIRIDKTETKIPRFATLPVAEWTAELSPFPKSGSGIEQVTVRPPKVGLVAGLSLELFEDLSPLALSLVQTQILRAVALSYDKGMLFGSGIDGEPLGVANTNLVAAEAGNLTSLGVFSRAIATLLGANATPRAVVMNPHDFGSLLELTELVASGGQGTDSLVPLVRASGGQGFELPYFPGLKWYLTPAAPQGLGVMYDSSTIAAVLRKQVEIAIDPWFGFQEAEVGLRCYLRGDVVVGQHDGIVRLEFA